MEIVDDFRTFGFNCEYMSEFLWYDENTYPCVVFAFRPAGEIPEEV